MTFLSVNLETTFQESENFNRLYLNVRRKFWYSYSTYTTNNKEIEGVFNGLLYNPNTGFEIEDVIPDRFDVLFTLEINV